MVSSTCIPAYNSIIGIYSKFEAPTSTNFVGASYPSLI